MSAFLPLSYSWDGDAFCRQIYRVGGEVQGTAARSLLDVGPGVEKRVSVSSGQVESDSESGDARTAGDDRAR